MLCLQQALPRQIFERGSMRSLNGAVARAGTSDSSSVSFMSAAVVDKTSINAECPDRIGLMGPGPIVHDRTHVGAERSLGER